MAAMNSELERVGQACNLLIESAFAVKAKVDENHELYEHPEFIKASKKLAKEIAGFFGSRPSPARWQWDVMWLNATYLNRVWESPQADQAVIAREYAAAIQDLLGTISDTGWLAVIPIERRFEGFERFVDLGPIGIVNPRNAGRTDNLEIAAEFADVLSEKWGVTFMDSPEVDRAFKRNVGDIEKRTAGTVPLYPQLVVPLGHAGINEAWIGVMSAASRYLPLIDCSVFLYDCISKGEGESCLPPGESKVAPQASRPLGMTIECVGNKALAVNTRTGGAHLHDTGQYPLGLLRVEPTSGELEAAGAIDQEKFLSYWGCAGRFMLMLEEHETNHPGSVNIKFVGAIDRALRLLAKCKYSLVHHLNDAMFNAVIATETILDPFDQSKEGLSERFAVFGSALVARDSANRHEWHDMAREFYKYRSKAGHQAKLAEHGYKTDVSVRDSVRFFFLCLQSIFRWSAKRLDNDQPIDKAAFEKFYRAAVLGNPGENQAIA